jgi:hypothetical protein
MAHSLFDVGMASLILFDFDYEAEDSKHDFSSSSVIPRTSPLAPSIED